MATDLRRLGNAGIYKAILADPPWAFATRSAAGQGKSASQHYAVQDLGWIKALPVKHIVAPDAALFLWATWPHLPQALEVMAAWGFDFKTGGAWAKRSKLGRTWAFGTGYIFRSASEPLLVGTRGEPRWFSSSERNLWIAPLREHSRKPDEVRDMILRTTAGPRLEMFARYAAPGFDRWGDEAPE
jgi:N6-adenosine-specific RNA methylase IME4